MGSKLEDYIEAGKRLDPDEREVAALALQHVDEAERADVDAAWGAEVDRRVQEIMSGEVELVDSQETFAIAREMLVAWRTK